MRWRSHDDHVRRRDTTEMRRRNDGQVTSAASIAAKAAERKRESRGSSDGDEQFLSNVKAAKTISVIVCNVLLCWLVYIIVVAVNFLGSYNPYITCAAQMVNSISVASNPVLYGLLNKSTRKIITEKC